MKKMFSLLLIIFVTGFVVLLSYLLNLPKKPNPPEWIEIVSARTPTSKVYRDISNYNRYSQDIAVGEVHYESGGDLKDIDLTPEKITTPTFDGWEITHNSWHYSLGETQGQDGWVGFGGQEGKTWFKFRLQNIGLLQNSRFDPLLTSAYDRSLLTLKNDEVQTLFDWQNVFTTPMGGAISSRWSVLANRLKEEIVFDEPARDWLKDLPSSVDSSLGFLFELDLNDFPESVKNKLIKSTPDIIGDAVASGTLLQNEADELVAFLPLDLAYVVDPITGDKLAEVTLSKKFFAIGGKYYLCLSAPLDSLQNLPAGQLIFDPTVDETVPAEADDGDQSALSGGTENIYNWYPDLATTDENWMNFRWTTVAIDQGATIDAAYITIHIGSSSRDNADATITFNDVDNASQIANGTSDGIPNAAKTTATVTWTETNAGGGTGNVDDNTPSLITPLQEVIDRASWATGNAIQAFFQARSTSSLEVYHYGASAALAARLHVEWTAAVSNTAPATPTLDTPVDTATNQSLTPVLQTTATDADSDYLRYKIELCTDASMTQNCQTFDQATSQTGWSGQDVQTNTAYASGTQATYTIQTALDPAVTYYWRSYAIDPAGTNSWSDTQATPYSFTTTTAPTAPGTPYCEGASNPSGIIDITPELSAVHSDTDSDSANYYEIEVNANSGFSGTVMWDTGKTGMSALASGARSTDVSYAGTALSYNGATYYWRIRFWDTLGAVSSWSTTQSFVMNSRPATPTLTSPADAATNQSLTPTLATVTTDATSDYLRYKIELCENVEMSTSCQTFDQTSSQTGWSGQDVETNTAYASGTTASYTISTSLAYTTTYYWRSYAIDPDGTNSWSSTQSPPYSFTTEDPPPGNPALNLEGINCEGVNLD